MEKGEKSSPSPSQGINYFDAANLLGASPFSSASATIAPSFAHLAHMPSAFSMLGHLPPFMAPPPFGGLGALSDPLRNSAALAHSTCSSTGGADWWRAASEHARRVAGNSASAAPGLDYFTGSLGPGNSFSPLFGSLAQGPGELPPPGFDMFLQPALTDKSSFLHSAFASASPLSLVAPLKLTSSLTSPSSSSSSKATSSKTSSSSLLYSTNTSRNSMHTLRRSPVRDSGGRKSRGRGRSSRSLGGNPTSVISSAHHKSDTALSLDMGKKEFSSHSAALLSSPSLSLLPRTENASKSGGKYSSNESDSQSDVSSVSSVSSEDSSGSSDEEDGSKKEKISKKKSRKSSPGSGPVIQIDGLKKQLMADQIRQKMQTKSAMPPPSSPGQSEGHRPRGRGRPPKNQQSNLTEEEKEEQRRRREDLKLQLEAELKQQQLQLKLVKRAQAQREREASLKAQKTRQLDEALNLQKEPSPSGKAKTHPSTEDLRKGIQSDHLVAKFKTLSEGGTDSNQSDISSDSDSEPENEETGSGFGSSPESGDSEQDRSAYSEGSASPNKGDKRTADESSDGSTPHKRRRVMDETELRIPLEHGWRRETRIRTVGMRGIGGEVLYYAPCGKKLKTYPDVTRYLERNGITDLTRENFTFSSKYNIGDFMEARHGENNFTVLTEEEVAGLMSFIQKKRSRPSKNMMRQELHRRQAQELARQAMETKLKRKLEQQGIDDCKMSRRTAEMKLLRKLEKQRQKEQEKRAKEMKVVEKRKQKDRLKMLKQHEKMQRQEQMRMEREMRAQQIIEARRRRREDLEKLRYEEALRKAKEREMKRQQAVLLKEQERERRRQHILLVKALEARKKQEEKERLKVEKKAEKIMVKEKKFEQKRLEIQLAQELKQPREDLELRDFRPMPELNRLAGVKLPGAALADCIMVLEFLNNFGEALGVDSDAMPNLDTLQKGLMNENEDAVEEVVSLVTHLVQFAIDDPGVPNPKEAVTKMGVKITDVEVNDTVVSEVLRLFIQARAGKKHELCGLLADKPLEALNTTQKAAILAFLCNELLCSRVITSEIDNNIETMSNLRRDKWIVEGKLRKLRTVVAKKFNRPENKCGSNQLESLSNSIGGETDGDASLSQCNVTSEMASKHGSDEEDEESGNESDATDATNATGNNSAEEDDPGTVEECEKKIEKLTKQHGQYRNKVFNASHRLRGICFGQDRYKRLYWAIPYLGGIFVEGLESGEVGEDDQQRQTDSPGKPNNPDQMTEDVKQRLEKCKEEIRKLENVTLLDDSISVKTEPMDTSEHNGVLEKMDVSTSEEQCKKETVIKAEQQNGYNHTSHSTSDLDGPINESKTLCNGDVNINASCDEDSKMVRDCASNLFLQKPNSSSTKLSEFMNIAKSEASAAEADTNTASSPLFTSSPITNGTNCSSTSSVETNAIESKPSFLSIDSMLKKDDHINGPSLLNNHFLPPGLLPAGPFSAEQMLKNLSDRQNQKPWFSILPRMPCDDLGTLNCTVPPPRAHVNNNNSMPSFLSPVPFRALHMQSPTFASFQMGQIGVSASDYNLLPLTPKNSSSLMEDLFKVPNTPGECPTTSNSPAPSDLLKYEPAEPMPIPQDTQRGWWRISEADQLKAVVRCLHPRGIRERNLQKTFQKLFDFACQSCSKGDREAIAIEESEKSEDEAEDETAEEPVTKEPAVEAPVPESTDSGPAGENHLKDAEDNKEDKEQEELAEKSTIEISIPEPELEPEKQEQSEVKPCSAPGPDDPNVWDAKVAFDIETSILEEVESMEDRIFTASLQVKGWKLPQKVGELEDKEPVGRELTVLKRNQIYPLDVAKDKLLHLEKNIERRYLKPPFCKSIQLKLENITAKLGEQLAANSSSERRKFEEDKKEDNKEDEEDKEEAEVEEEEEMEMDTPKEEKLPAGLVAWRIAVTSATSPAQLALCLYQLNRSIAWEKSIMKVLCQICRKDDNEAELLLCDSCDKGYHTYCFKPKLVTIPDGDWYCFECISKATGQPHCAVCGKKMGKLLECSTCPRAVHMDCMETPPAKVPKKWFCASCMAEKLKNKRDRKRVRREEKKEAKKERKDSESAMDTSTSETPTKSKKGKSVSVPTTPTVVDSTPDSEDLEPCRVLMPEMEKHEESWPFLQPVNTKQFPQYKKFIKQPMDFSTMRNKLRDNLYKSRGEFAADARLVFNNCETFNEDDSEVGKAGHTMRKMFEQRWKELCSIEQS